MQFLYNFHVNPFNKECRIAHLRYNFKIQKYKADRKQHKMWSRIVLFSLPLNVLVNVSKCFSMKPPIKNQTSWKSFFPKTKILWLLLLFVTLWAYSHRKYWNIKPLRYLVSSVKNKKFYSYRKKIEHKIIKIELSFASCTAECNKKCFGFRF